MSTKLYLALSVLGAAGCMQTASTNPIPSALGDVAPAMARPLLAKNALACHHSYVQHGKSPDGDTQRDIETKTTYNAAGQVELEEIDDNGVASKRTTEYDAQGNPTKRTTVGADGSTATEVLTYDVFGRLLRDEHGTDSYDEYTYGDGPDPVTWNLVNRTPEDDLSQTTTFHYAADGRLDSYELVIAGVEGRTSSSFSYDDDARVVSETYKDASGAVVGARTATYDDDNNLLRSDFDLLAANGGAAARNVRHRERTYVDGRLSSATSSLVVTVDGQPLLSSDEQEAWTYDHCE